MNTAIAHRGPDGEGVYISPNGKIGLGHRRLAVIDLSPLGSQPMRYMDRYEIVFNGEIYNFQEQKLKLQRLGYRFFSHTDTEVIMALYDKYGIDCLQYLRGMFAFALYDEKTNYLFCARDRTGQKPFKYYANNTTFIFASEIKAILTQKEYKKLIDKSAIQNFLVLQYAPGSQTGFADIKKLEPAEYMVIDCGTGKITKQKYWDIDYRNKKIQSTAAWEQDILTRLRSSIQEQMVADVPLGVMLSGGIDSSIIVALMAEQSLERIETFSVGFAKQKNSELPYARIIAKQFRTSHHELTISPTHIDILPSVVRTMEEPFGDHGVLPTFLISDLIRKKVTVALNGDGGDENFAGYDRYTACKLSRLLSPVGPIIKQVTRMFPHTQYSDRWIRFAQTLSLPEAQRYLQYISYIQPQIAYKVSHNPIEEAWKHSKSKNWLDILLYTDFHTYLPGALLPKVDMATMVHSLEARSPFLDHSLLELTAAIPENLKIRGLNNRKYILKELSADFLPREIIYRKKQGFSVPLNDWFQDDILSYAKNMLASPSSRITEFVSQEYVQSILSGQRSIQTEGRKIWILIMLELWIREYFT